MKIFVAGGSGVVGRHLIPLLVNEGHDVVALTRSEGKVPSLRALGAQVTVADALDRNGLTEAIRAAAPDVIIHQLTALAGVLDLKQFDRSFAHTNRLRTEAVDTMLSAAKEVGTRRFIAQSFCGWPFAPVGGPVKSEDDPLDPDPPECFRRSLAAIAHLESAVRRTAHPTALALRYGMFYGPGTQLGSAGPMVSAVRARKVPIIGGGQGVWSFVHIEDVVRITATAVERGAPGIYNIVDDEPAPVAEWLPFLAGVLGVRPPRRVPAWLGRFAIGDCGVAMMTRARGGSNAKAKREFAWQPIYPSWRQGFREGLG